MPKTVRASESPDRMPALFRDVEMPSHAHDRQARERYLLDTYAERRATERPGSRSAAWVRRVLARITA